MTRQQHEIEAIFNLVDTVFDSDTGHWLLLAMELLRKISVVGIHLARGVQGNSSGGATKG
jgi:hypothetical protein